MIPKLREARNEKGLSQKEVAKRINLTQQTYSDYETGRTNPDIETLIEIANILETSVDYILGRSDDFGNITIKEKSPSKITSEEQALLDDFRSLPRRNAPRQLNTYVTSPTNEVLKINTLKGDHYV